VPFLFFYSLFLSKSWRSFKIFRWTMYFAFGFSAIKLIPVFETILTYPRFTPIEFSGFSIRSLLHSLISPKLDFAFGYADEKTYENFWIGESYTIEENSMYMGLLAFCFLLIGLIKYWKKHKPLVFVSLIFIILSLGNHVPALLRYTCNGLSIEHCSAWEWFHELPVFNQSRIAHRFLT